MPKNINTAILGASGYTGAELVRLLSRHPHVTITALAADRKAGLPMAEVYPHLSGLNLPELQEWQSIDWQQIDVVFCALPHGMTQAVAKELPKSLVIIDLSADFRITDTKTYAKWYSKPHEAPELQQEAVYGLTEHARDAVKSARLIACPGCYPTASLLPLLPLVKHGLIDLHSIIIDAKSGVTGAGRAAKEASLYTEVNDGLHAYAVGQHRHMPEIEQVLTHEAGAPAEAMFTPHLVPMSRGILATIYATLAEGKTLENARAALQETYTNEPFVTLLPEGQLPATRHVKGSNHCHIALVPGRNSRQIVLLSAIDNLVKGASGQAVHNMNLRFGFEETTGLEQVALFP